MRCRTRNALVVLTAALAACTRLEPVRDCQPRGPARPVCGFQNPEDLVPLPDGRRLLVSEFGNIEGTRPGRIVLYDLATDARTVLYEGGAPAASAERWGDPACPGPPSRAFAPHGIDLGRRPDGGLVLLAVDHGGREAIEFFDVTVDGAVAVTWRGCAMPPPGSFLNDVASLPDGGCVTTHMYERSTGTVGDGACSGLISTKPAPSSSPPHRASSARSSRSPWPQDRRDRTWYSWSMNRSPSATC